MIGVPVPWVFVLAYLCGVAIDLAFPLRPPLEAMTAVKLFGGVLFIAGALVAGWGWMMFWKARTTRVPGKESSSLVTGGPYRFMRNPMYVGLTLAYLGEAGMLTQIWPLLFLPLVLVYLNRVVIPLEERKLKEVFGTSYDDYRLRVHRWI